jgi:ectoine hydroxylase-related dioxygenase (phytanoyl-CoA dioxygenase family)
MDTASVALRENFQRDGFVVLDRLLDATGVSELRVAYDQLLSGEIDCSATDNPLGRVTRQIMQPWRYHPVFAHNDALRRGLAVARTLLGVDEPQPIFQMLIYKEPGQMATTPWHQDFAYTQMPSAPAGANIPPDSYLQFWVALDDVDEANGCMHFLPGEHHAPLHDHYVAGGEPTYSQRLLAIREPEKVFDLQRAVACPLRAGGATVHGYGTPHFTPGNRTPDRPRRAYIFNFSTPRPGFTAPFEIC